jgi:hypothetical protein
MYYVWRGMHILGLKCINSLENPFTFYEFDINLMGHLGHEYKRDLCYIISCSLSLPPLLIHSLVNIFSSCLLLSLYN